MTAGAPKFIYARADGEDMGEYRFFCSDTPDDWDGADADGEDSDKPVEYLMWRVDPEPVDRKTVYPYGWCKTHGRFISGCEDEENLEGECVEP